MVWPSVGLVSGSVYVGGSAGAGAGGAQMGWAHSYQLTLTAHSLGWPACVMFLFYQILILTTP